jgi:hypothetical protein
MPGFRIAEAAGSDYELDLPEDKDIKRAHRWRINKLGPTLEQNDLLFAKSVTMPTISFIMEEVVGGSISYKFAKRPEFGDLEIAFYDVEGLEPKIRKWHESVWSPKTSIGKADDYVDEVELFLTDGYGDPLDNSWKFINAWPKTINHGELLYDVSDFKLITVTIAYSWIEYPSQGAARGGARARRGVKKMIEGTKQIMAQTAQALGNIF